MGGKQKSRIEETIHQLVAGLLVRRVKDPRVENVSIIGVEVSGDFSVAKISYNIVGGGKSREEVQKGLESCKGYLRSHIRKHLHLKMVPELIFSYDTSLDRAMLIEELIQRIHEERKNLDEDAEDE